MKIKRAWLTASLLCLAGAAASGGFWWGAEHRFPYNQLKRWQKERATALHPKQQVLRELNPPVDVVMVGDSLTEYYQWGESLRGVVVANRGVGGDTTADVLRRMDAIVSTKAKKALVMVGINDVYEGVPLAQIVSNYQRITERLSASQMAIVIQSTLECERRKCGAARLAQVRELNRELQALAERRNYQYINVNEGAVTEGGLLSTHTYDGVHLTAAGYRHWLSRISPMLSI